MEDIPTEDFDDAIIRSSKDGHLVLFYADWCPFCTRFKPVFESAKPPLSYKLSGTKLNDDDNPLWERFSIETVPTIIGFDKGKVVVRKDGKMGVGLSKPDLDAILRQLKKD